MTVGRRRARARAPRALVLVAAALAATAACSAAGDGPGGGPAGRSAAGGPSAAAPSATAAGRISLPIDRFTLTADESYAVERAKVLLTNECLRGFGLDYRVPESPPPTAEPSRRYGIADREAARDRGYHLPASTGRSGAPAAEPTETQAVVLLGTTRAGEPRSTTADGRPIPPGGCYGEAETRLDGGARPESDIAAASAVDTDSYKQSLEDPTVTAVFHSWSACMERHGHHYESPIASVGDKAFDTAEPTPRERAVALADVGCKTETGLLQTWTAAESAIQTRMIGEKSAVLDRLTAFQKRKITTAREAIARLGR
ncbi:hypothetical protein [Kitasatospora sp. DSM 101779]|uniref:hypothetical protein n=1 Tax=Kitasatospora sp. DSM 101779 TaxID=2853165 RepID=UPI0021D83625|nr:hypothetical protein [Kitasatospora sp. DSM 101779]MCU7824968.1 hypothetical protein [Kitasatospora sp. DSM 101779]